MQVQAQFLEPKFKQKNCLLLDHDLCLVLAPALVNGKLGKLLHNLQCKY